MYQERTYRKIQNTKRFFYFRIIVEESDLWIGVTPSQYYDELPAIISDYLSILRREIESVIEKHPKFQNSHLPLGLMKSYGQIVERMTIASVHADIGPMAAVAGAVSELIGEKLQELLPNSEIIIENGGDIWARFHEPLTISIEAGDSPFSANTGFILEPYLSPCGVCSSSGKIGYSFSYGKADNVTIICKSASIADAWATALCNKIHSKNSLHSLEELTSTAEEILGFIAIFDDSMIAGGNLEITSLKSLTYEV